MQLITKEILRDKESKEDLQVALTDMLSGIREDWQLTVSELAGILSQPESTVKGWLKSKGHMGLSSVIDHNTQAIVDFINIYDMVASFFVQKSDQMEWFKNPSNRFGGQSPLEMISENPHNLALAKTIVSRMLNP